MRHRFAFIAYDICGVRVCSIIGLRREPDEDVGELPVAFVVRSNGSNISEEEIKKYIAKKVRNK